MNMVISVLERIVEAACASETNCFGYGIWTHHILRVVEHGQRLADRCGADAEIVVIAALLHDYASIKDIELAATHHLHSALEADKLLTALGYPPEQIEQVKDCILSHRASVPMVRRSVEAQCLADADAIAHIEQVPSLLFYVFVQRQMAIAPGTQWVRDKLERSWGKLSRQAQDMMAEQYEAAVRTLTPLP